MYTDTYYSLLTKLPISSPAEAINSEILTITAGKATINTKESFKDNEITTYQYHFDNENLISPLIIVAIVEEPTPGKSMVHGHLLIYIINFDNKQVKINSFDKHPTNG